MERVAFLLEGSGERVSALLNPDSVSLARRSGVRTLHQRPGTITGAPASDDLVISTGGGRTEIVLDLMFDVSLAGSDPAVTDVRQLTGPLWELSENQGRPIGPPTVRLVWGKSWNVPGVIESVSERLERFASTGAPTRSWLRLRLLRTSEPEATIPNPPPTPEPRSMPATPRAPVLDDPGVRFHEVTGSAGEAGTEGERLDEIAGRYLGDPAFWRHLAAFNGIDDPPWVEAGRILVIPPIEQLISPSGEGGDGRGPTGAGAQGPPSTAGTAP